MHPCHLVSRAIPSEEHYWSFWLQRQTQWQVTWFIFYLFPHTVWRNPKSNLIVFECLHFFPNPWHLRGKKTIRVGWLEVSQPLGKSFTKYFYILVPQFSSPCAPKQTGSLHLCSSFQSINDSFDSFYSLEGCVIISACQRCLCYRCSELSLVFP